MKRMNVQQLISLGMAALMAHPALWPAGQALAQERRQKPIGSAAPPLVAANRRVTKKSTPRIAPQVAAAYAGESTTLLPDGRILTAGGLGPSGVSARAVLGAPWPPRCGVRAPGTPRPCCRTAGP
jgi:hypothetical protein